MLTRVSPCLWGLSLWDKDFGVTFLLGYKVQLLWGLYWMYQVFKEFILAFMNSRMIQLAVSSGYSVQVFSWLILCASRQSHLQGFTSFSFSLGNYSNRLRVSENSCTLTCFIAVHGVTLLSSKLDVIWLYISSLGFTLPNISSTATEFLFVVQRTWCPGTPHWCSGLKQHCQSHFHIRIPGRPPPCT